MHSSINYPSIQAVIQSIDTVHENFPWIDQQITEMDVSVYNAGDDTSNYGNNIPPSVLAEQGWLYKQYFDAYKELRGKVSAVTFWGMADDDTWLDSFPVVRSVLCGRHTSLPSLTCWLPIDTTIWSGPFGIWPKSLAGSAWSCGVEVSGASRSGCSNALRASS